MRVAEIGYTMLCEQRSPKDLVDDLVRAERAVWSRSFATIRQ
jgi:hypothetical protein